MNIIDRLLLLIFSIIVAVTSFIFLFLPVPFLPDQFSEAMRRFIFESSGMALISIVLLLISLRFIFKTTSAGISTYDYISKQTEMGEIRISFNTIKALALSGIKNIPGIRNSRVQISDTNGEVSIVITAAFATGTLIPEVSRQIQRSIKELVEATTEITVKEVVVYADETNNSDKRRVG